MKQLAIDAANDSNTDEDRRTLQKEFDSRAATINDIAIGTQYNGKRLLDGTGARKQVMNFSRPDPETLGTSDDGAGIGGSSQSYVESIKLHVDTNIIANSLITS